MQPEFKGNLTQAAVHQLHEKQGARPKQKKQQNERGGPDNQKCTKRETCFSCGAKPAYPRSECSAKKAKCFKCGKDGHYGSVCKSKSTGGSVNELQTQPIDPPSNEDSTAEDYTPMYFTATVHHLKMVMVKTLNCPQPKPHIHPLWLSKELSSQISRSLVKSIQVQAATFYLCTKQQLLLERISSWDNRRWIWKATMTAQ